MENPENRNHMGKSLKSAYKTLYYRWPMMAGLSVRVVSGSHLPGGKPLEGCHRRRNMSALPNVREAVCIQVPSFYMDVIDTSGFWLKTQKTRSLSKRTVSQDDT